MIAVLPGQPQSKLQGFITGCWDGCRYNAYISGNSFTVLSGSNRLIQTVYDDESEQSLDAIILDEATGKIATCTAEQVRIYRPLVLHDEGVKWAQQTVFSIPHPTIQLPSSLSWGSSEELIVASSSISLFTTRAEISKIWQKNLPNPAKSAVISYDSAYVASIGLYDRIVKLWRRLTCAIEEVRFDVSHLRHPDVVISVKWRRPEQVEDNALYTSCRDRSIYIWIPSEANEGKQWQLSRRITPNESSLNNTMAISSPIMFIIDGRDFSPAVETAARDRANRRESTGDAAFETLITAANKRTDVCVSISRLGNISVWALNNTRNSEKDALRILSIAQVRLPHLDTFIPSSNGETGTRYHHFQVQSYCDRSTGRLQIMIHLLDDTIRIFACDLANLLDPVMHDRCLELQSVWTGHTASVKKIVRNISGHAVVSRTNNGQCILWKHSTAQGSESGQTLTRHITVPADGNIHRICVLRKGRFVVFLSSNSVVLWDCRYKAARLLARCSLSMEGSPLCLIVLPRPQRAEYRIAYIATVMSTGSGIVWELELPQYLSTGSHDDETASLSEFCRFDLGTAETPKYVLPVDPAGAAPVMSGFLDVFARDVAISYTNTGTVNFWTTHVDVKGRRVVWLSTSSTHTGLVEIALASGSMLKKAALVNSTRSQLTIWDIGGSRLEFEQNYKTQHHVQDLDWTSTPDAQAILAVGFQHHVVLLSQMRFDYLNKGPAWAPVHEINVGELTPHPIGDSAWLANGYLVIGSGNQLIVKDRRIDGGQSAITCVNHVDNAVSDDLFDAVQKLNGPLPVFHPQFISQCILAGKWDLSRNIMLALYRTLKYIVPGDAVDDYLGIHVSSFYLSSVPLDDETNTIRELATVTTDGEDDDFLTERVAASTNDKLSKVRLPQLSGHEQIQLADMIECVASVESHRRSMDENGARFMLFFRQHALRKGRPSQMQLSWREFNWAFHSSSQDILLDFVSRHNQGSMRWEQARETGVFMWLSDATALRNQFEIMAKNEYTNSELKDPVECSLFYLALRNKTMLQRLWRIASWNKEQTATQKLLANDFCDPRWQRTALKNAYALLSKRRFRYAAAFFLLADHLEDAVGVCLRQLNDLQLAIAISRIYEGDEGPVIQKIIHDEVLSLAAQEDNRWLASWAFWMLDRRDMAVKALLMPVFALLETPCSLNTMSRTFLTDDPALVVLYSQLRSKTLQSLRRGASKVDPKIEWEFVLHSAKLYDRMGCDLLGLDLVRNWKFQQPIATRCGEESNPSKLHRRRELSVVDDLSVSRHGLKPEQAENTIRSLLPQARDPESFIEPSASSLLDSFGI
ncbi:hypothetical protein E4U47_005120 [Claviceps purpurea]|nr:hypothetical protein E4U37_004906 [Claviceps purpurea]KAG6151694.1 hypothetical protein E4U11_007767 [Claviceps purpurea]KAG6176088.1 hypothetical protein E4U36_008271 [Claviceps purpurea]KAG6230422.1 hypothetical protein E4U25_007185 [Claviceps purpurea]KAG6245557.1 hypothetical protein E4U23_005268 [Claviceps purpurea]